MVKMGCFSERSLRLDLHAGQDVRVEVQLVVVGVGVGAGDVLDHIHGVVVQIDVVLAIGIGANFHRADQLIVRVVGNGHIALGFQNDFIGAGVVDGDLALTLEVICLLGDVVVGLFGFAGTATQQNGCGQRKGEKNLFHGSFLSVKMGKRKPPSGWMVVNPYWQEL